MHPVIFLPRPRSLQIEGVLAEMVEPYYYKHHSAYKLDAGFTFDRIENLESPPDTPGHYYIRLGAIYFMETCQEQVPLVNVPPVIYSETLRDVDFFVRSSDIGNAPGWEGVGNSETCAAWYRYAFGKLLASAAIRKIVLKFIVPQLPVAGKVSVEGDYLKVNNYKIHIGSGQVVKGSDNEFVRLRTGGEEVWLDKVFMPVERDDILNLIIDKVFILTKYHGT